MQICPICSFCWLLLCPFVNYQDVCILDRFVAIYVETSYLAPFKSEVLHSGCAGVIQADVVEGPYGPAEQQMDGVEDSRAIHGISEA